MVARILILVAGLVSHQVTEGAEDHPPSAPRSSWEVSDFDAVIFVGLEGYRDFENGSRVFQRASCAKCHGFGDVGRKGAVAPELAKATALLTPQELLEAILVPDKVLKAGYETHRITMDDGRVFEGLVRGDSDSKLHLVPDAGEPGKSVFFSRDRIRKRSLTDISAMPSGLLDRFGEDDILDLLAYLLSGGDPKDSMFRK